MKANLTVLCASFLFCVRASAQNIDSAIVQYADRYDQERSYLHFDKSSYAPGETIWFKAYLMDGIYPTNASKTFYTDWSDDQGNLLAHNLTPIADATSNGQFDIPAAYSGKYIHIKAYSRWMLNFDSAFLFNKDIRVISKNTGKTVPEITIIPSLQFFPEGGDPIAGIINKIAFKANDQWGRPVNIKGVIVNKEGKLIDSLRTMHDGMGFFNIIPLAGESFTAKWFVKNSSGNNKNGEEHITSLPEIKSEGISLQVTVDGTKRHFLIRANRDIAGSLDSVHLIGTMYQTEIFKLNAGIKSGPVKGVIPLQDLPTGILTITVFDKAWNPLAERITYVNNEDYLFHPELTVEHWGLNRRSRNEIQITVPDSLPANFSIAVTDAGLDADSSDNIISHLLLTGEIKGQVYNPSHYFMNASDSISQQLDLVMLTHGWRRFKWDEIVKQKFPKINFPKDTSYLTLSGRVYGATSTQARDAPSIIMIMNQKNVKGQMLVLPVERNGTFNEPSLIIFDTAHIWYRLSKSLGDASVGFMENRLPRLPYTLAATGFFYNQVGDTTGDSRHFMLSEETLQLMKQYEGKVLENVIVKAKMKSPVEMLDEKYASGLFRSGDGYNFDMTNDRTSAGSLNIFSYLQGKVAGLQITTGGMGSLPTLQWRGSTPQLFVDEVPTDVDMVSSIPVTDIAYVKVFRPPFFGASGGGSGGAIAIYTRRGDDIKSTPGKGLANNMVTGYTDIRQFYSPNYGAISAENEKRDNRTTLYWNPQVLTTTKKNKVLLFFYNNDVSHSFRVVIEGMSKDGRLAHIEQIME